MNNIRKIIEQRLENARNDFLNAINNGKITDREIGELQYTVLTYQDCLNLMQPRTEQEILKEFEMLGYIIAEDDNSQITMTWRVPNTIGYFILNIFKSTKSYKKMCIVKGESYPADIDMQEHKLLNELFALWGLL